MASPPPSETCVCGREKHDHYSIPTLDRDALFCSKWCGARYVPLRDGARVLREYHKALDKIASCFCAVGAGCHGEKKCVTCIARAALADSVSAPEKPAVQP
jgi:poly-beta-hydroxyalkanoate depolymerase